MESESLFYTILSNAITVNSLVSLFSDEISNWIYERWEIAYSIKSFKYFSWSTDSVFSVLKRLMIFEMIWAILQLFGIFSLKGKSSYACFLLFIPQVITIVIYIFIFWLLISRILYIALVCCRLNPSKKRQIIGCFLISIVSEPLFPNLTDWAVQKILRSIQGVLRETEDIGDNYNRKDESHNSETFSPQQEAQGHDNLKKMRDKFNQKQPK